MRKGYFDNDILIKLAGCGLVEDARQQLGIEEDWVLSSLGPQLKNPKRRGKLAKYVDALPRDAQSRIQDFAASAKRLPPAIDQEFVCRYIDQYNLDSGEIQLLEAAFRSDNPVMITGDKRFLEQLAKIPELLTQAIEKLPGRFACLESVLLLLIERNGFEYVRDRALILKEYEGQIKIAFGGSEPKTELQAREALEYELCRLGNEIGRLLHYTV